MNNSSHRFIWPVRVYYEDTDSGGLVYYANYLKFMERARTEWLRSIGFEQDRLLRQDGIIFAVRQVEVGYHQPARFNDELEISSSLLQKGRASLTFHQEVVRPADAQLLCKGKIKIACVGMKNMRPLPIPKKLLLEIPDVD
ncbi:MAG: tol-pal system-associated acyl-CoA thioesterase [Candidatus Thiodiazotropha sp. (ex Epidulcina cf. delphinae)]|nr:tol-pal system-associated acyl-CoA thioesterase [Candidatus Thiodiazotropha sp. (ex Epidulcina cf. delphinae)]